MNNHFVKIGQLLLDLRKNIPSWINETRLTDIGFEFLRIKSSLMIDWANRPPELGYQMQFHYLEAKRLLADIKPGDLKDKKAGNSALISARLEFYEQIFKGLTAVIWYLELLREGKPVKLKMD